MLVTIQNARPVGGTITAPPSKSMAHRAVLCAALAEGRSHITNLEFSKDISATLGAAAQLCARVRTGAAMIWPVMMQIPGNLSLKHPVISTVLTARSQVLEELQQ